MRFFLTLLLISFVTSAKAANVAPPPSINLMPEFIRNCMSSAPDTESISSYLLSIGAIPVPDSEPGTSNPKQITGFLFVYPDYTVSVLLSNGNCAVTTEGLHGTSTLSSFDNFIQSASQVFDVTHEEVATINAEDQILSSYLLSDKDKQFTNRFTLSVVSIQGKPPLTIISRKLGAYKSN